MRAWSLIRCASRCRARRRRSGGDRPCPRPARTAARPWRDRTPRSPPRARPKGSRLPCAGYRCRARPRWPCGHRRRARCPRACATGRSWPARTLRKAATLSWDRSRRGPRIALGGMGHGGLTHPGAVVPGIAPRLHQLLGDRTFAAPHGVEFLPVDLAEVVAALGFVPLQVRVRHRQPDRLSLGHGDVDELLAELIIG